MSLKKGEAVSQGPRPGKSVLGWEKGGKSNETGRPDNDPLSGNAHPSKDPSNTTEEGGKDAGQTQSYSELSGRPKKGLFGRS